ncbi:MAG: ribosome assembly cofactor RimP [Spirochaetales bacterium]|nr:ribosome assembly cofactor RimP [Spirochaetales bacterium]
MEYRLEQEKLYDLIEPVVSGLGFKIVELNSRTVQGRLHINLVLFSPEGVGLDECAKVHRTIIPRLEMAEENRDIYLEVGSPGLSRNIKSAEEFQVFKGRGFRVLTESADEWLGGIIGDIIDDKLKVLEINEAGEEVLKVELSVKDIRKAKLDDTQEIRR